jgi:hypothetical protein
MQAMTRTAWEPITPRGVAAFARAKTGRLLWVQLIIALVVAVSVCWFLYEGCCPTIRKAILGLPVEGEIRSGRLDWRGESPTLLAEGRFVGFSVDRDGAGDLGSPAHVQIEFRQEAVLFHSLFGYWEARYPTGWVIGFNRTELQPWWGAWQPWLLAMAAGATIAGLMLLWAVIAALYAGPVWLVGFYANRDLSLVSSWKLAGAALMPGALLMAGAILLYKLAILDLMPLAVALGAHLVWGWIYLVVSPLQLPLEPATTTQGNNPFASPPAR